MSRRGSVSTILSILFTLHLLLSCAAVPFWTEEELTSCSFDDDCNEGFLCYDGECLCPENAIFDSEENACLSVISFSDDCTHDNQCRNTAYGKFSRCNKQTNKCECFDFPESGRRPVAEYREDGEPYCYLKKFFNDSCSSDVECHATMGRESECSNAEYGIFLCGCEKNSFWLSNLKKCLPVSNGDLGSDCEDDLQCSKSSMGELSRCNSDNECECYNSRSNDYRDVTYYEPLHTCFEKKSFNDTCIQDAECIASLGKNAVCAVGDVCPGRQCCQCPEGEYCHSSASKNLIIFSVIPCLLFYLFFINRT